ARRVGLVGRQHLAGRVERGRGDLVLAAWVDGGLGGAVGRVDAVVCGQRAVVGDVGDQVAGRVVRVLVLDVGAAVGPGLGDLLDEPVVVVGVGGGDADRVCVADQPAVAVVGLRVEQLGGRRRRRRPGAGEVLERLGQP